MLRQSWSQPSLWLHTVTSRLVSEHVRTVHFTIDTGQNYARLSKTVIKSKYYKIGLYSFCSLLNPILSLCSLDSSPQSQPKHTECQCHLYSANMFQIVSNCFNIFNNSVQQNTTLCHIHPGPWRPWRRHLAGCQVLRDADRAIRVHPCCGRSLCQLSGFQCSAASNIFKLPVTLDS